VVHALNQTTSQVFTDLGWGVLGVTSVTLPLGCCGSASVAPSQRACCATEPCRHLGTHTHNQSSMAYHRTQALCVQYKLWIDKALQAVDHCQACSPRHTFTRQSITADRVYKKSPTKAAPEHLMVASETDTVVCMYATLYPPSSVDEAASRLNLLCPPDSCLDSSRRGCVPQQHVHRLPVDVAQEKQGPGCTQQ
jgi:hypothetical protein